MISREMIEKGLDCGLIKLEPDGVMGSGTVCRIGDYAFWFGGEQAEKMSPDEYLKNIPRETIVEEILDTLMDFGQDDSLEDEYLYYDLYLSERLGIRPINVELKIQMKVKPGGYDEIKKLEHHIEYLLDLDNYPEIETVYGVKVKRESDMG